MGWGNVLSYVSLSLFTQHKVGKGYISMTALQKKKKKKAEPWSSLTIKVRKKNDQSDFGMYQFLF